MRNLRFLKEKMQFARPGVAVPGNWYADERFARIWMTKSVMKLPGTTQEAVAQALAVMQTVAVPQGLQMGTDSAPGDGGDYTIWGAVYDHRQPCLYWHSARRVFPKLRHLLGRMCALKRKRALELRWFETGRKGGQPLWCSLWAWATREQVRVAGLDCWFSGFELLVLVGKLDTLNHQATNPNQQVRESFPLSHQSQITLPGKPSHQPLSQQVREGLFSGENALGIRCCAACV